MSRQPPTDGEGPRRLYTAEGVRQLDRQAIESAGIPAELLMERAGEFAWQVLRDRWPGARSVVCVCGSGNNGGDGLVVARRARQQGLAATALTLGDPAGFSQEARAQLTALSDAGVQPQAFSADLAGGGDVLVDAILGTGLSRPVTEQFAAAIASMNQSGVPILALDIPSGLHADTGQVLGAAVRASATATFIGLKQGLFTGAGPAHAGEVHFSDLQVPGEIYAHVAPSAELADARLLSRHLSRRPRDSHKGHFGHVLVVGGHPGYAGAVRLAAEAAARVGAGLVSVATHPEHAAVIAAGRPEIMVHGVLGAAELRPLLERATVVAAGPGLARTGWSTRLFSAVLECGSPMVLDADALNLLAEEPVSKFTWVLTPHPGEAGRLLQRTTAAVQSDRFAAAADIQRQFGGACVLKGCGTIIQDGAGPAGVVAAGNPGLSSGGSGDVLTGVIAGLLAQGLTLGQASRCGAYLHAAAADQAADDGERGMLASDLFPGLRRLANP